MTEFSYATNFILKASSLIPQFSKELTPDSELFACYSLEVFPTSLTKNKLKKKKRSEFLSEEKTSYFTPLSQK